jgi:tetratricopeptide (TPR) repeat protein
LNDDAESYFRKAMEFKPSLTESYYNLAVLYNSENKKERAIKLLDTCLKINRDFSKASSAMKRMKSLEETDWFDYWFHGGKSKKLFAGILMIGIFLTFLAILYEIVMDNKQVNIEVPTIGSFKVNQSTLKEQENTADNYEGIGLILLLGLWLVVLLLPSLKKVKLAQIELDTESTDPRTINLETVFGDVYTSKSSSLSM